jgi:hypothetical protein
MYPGIDRNSIHPFASYKFILAYIDIIPEFVIFLNFFPANSVIQILWHMTYLPAPFFHVKDVFSNLCFFSKLLQGINKKKTWLPEAALQYMVDGTIEARIPQEFFSFPVNVMLYSSKVSRIAA